MNDTDVRNKVLEVFQKSRPKKDVEFQDSHFMDYLIHPPSPKHSLKNSVRGTKAYYAFMNDLELEFGICFSYTELDKYYNVNSLTKKIIERIQKRRSNLGRVKSRMKFNIRDFSIDIILIIALVMFCTIFYNSLILYLVIGVFLIIMIRLYRGRFRSKQHDKRLYKLIMSKEV